MTIMETVMNWMPLILPLGTAFIGVVIWGIRLEGLVKLNKQDLNHLEDRLDRQDNEIKERLAKIDGRLETIASSLERVIWRIPRPIDADRNPNDL